MTLLLQYDHLNKLDGNKKAVYCGLFPHSHE